MLRAFEFCREQNKDYDDSMVESRLLFLKGFIVLATTLMLLMTKQ